MRNKVCWYLRILNQPSLSLTHWPKSVDESDFVGRACNSCFCDQNRLTIGSRLEIKSFSRAEFSK